MAQAEERRVNGHRKRATGWKVLSIMLALSSLTGCLSPLAMHRAVIEYDRTVSEVEAEML